MTCSSHSLSLEVKDPLDFYLKKAIIVCVMCDVGLTHADIHIEVEEHLCGVGSLLPPLCRCQTGVAPV